MFDTTPLERLALALDHAAEVSEAKMKQHMQAGEGVEAAREAKRSARNIQYAIDVRAAVEELKKPRVQKVRPGQPNKPTWAEAFAYSKEIGFPEKELQGWFDHFTSNGWKVGKARTPMVDWKSAIRNGKRTWEKERGGRPVAVTKGVKTADPHGWTEFLKDQGKEYQPFQFAMPYLKDDFRKANRNGKV